MAPNRILGLIGKQSVTKVNKYLIQEDTSGVELNDTEQTITYVCNPLTS